MYRKMENYEESRHSHPTIGGEQGSPPSPPRDRACWLVPSNTMVSLFSREAHWTSKEITLRNLLVNRFLKN